ncbi:hypothetical protein BaRGS_00023202, partial [Batillaria attramentaria]
MNSLSGEPMKDGEVGPTGEMVDFRTCSSSFILVILSEQKDESVSAAGFSSSSGRTEDASFLPRRLFTMEYSLRGSDVDREFT